MSEKFSSGTKNPKQTKSFPFMPSTPSFFPWNKLIKKILKFCTKRYLDHIRCGQTAGHTDWSGSWWGRLSRLNTEIRLPFATHWLAPTCKGSYQMPKRGWGEGWSYYLTWTGRKIAEWHTGNCVIVAGNCVIVVYVSLSWYWKKFITQPIIRHTDWSIPNNSIVFGKNKKEKKKSSNDTRSIYRLTFDVTFISKHYSLFHYANVDIHVP